MNSLKMSIDEINQQMKFSSNKLWNNVFGTNCYGYVLGIDISENDIIKGAFQPGTIGSVVYNISDDDLDKMSLEERMYLDFDALNISYSECSESEVSSFYVENGFIVFQWIVALFIWEGFDFHFMKKAWNNVWWHKRTYDGTYPTNQDDIYNKIYSPQKCFLKNYKYVKCLKLRYREKRNTFF